VPEIDAWVRSLTADYGPETIRHHVGLFRRIVGKARGQYQLPPIDWDLITLPAVENEHAKNRPNSRAGGRCGERWLVLTAAAETPARRSQPRVSGPLHASRPRDRGPGDRQAWGR
jgi:hypothetical protein